MNNKLLLTVMLQHSLTAHAQVSPPERDSAVRFIEALGGSVASISQKQTAAVYAFLGNDQLWGKFTCIVDREPRLIVVSTHRQSNLDRGLVQRNGRLLWENEGSARTYLTHVGEQLSPTRRCLINWLFLSVDELSGRHPTYARLDAKVSFTFDDYAWIDRICGVMIHADRQDGAILSASQLPNSPPVSEHARMELTLAQARERIHARWPSFDVSKFIYYLGWCKPAEGDVKGVISYQFVRGTPHHPSMGSEIYYCEAIPNGRLWMSPPKPLKGPSGP